MHDFDHRTDDANRAWNNLSVYDAHYVALAESFGVPLITSDARIERSGAARCTIETYEASST